MEENQNTEVPSEVATPSEVPSCPEVSEESCASQPEVKQHARKNGRNRSCKRGAKQASAEAESCGELENPAEFHEKLSGSNVSGYAENDRQKRERRGEKRDRRADRPDQDSAESVEASNEASEPEHQGPSFESKKFTSRAVEVGLSDRRPKVPASDNANDGVVSYTPEDSKCSISLFDRIKNIFKSIFGKSEKSKKRYNKRGGKKNWSNNRDGGKRYNNNNRHNNNRKGGYNKRRFNDRRPNNGGGKPRGNGDAQ